MSVGVTRRSYCWIAPLALLLASCGGGGDAGDEEPDLVLQVEPVLVSAPVDVIHEVRPGETFGVIAESHGIPYAEMLALVEAAAEHQDLTRIRDGRVLQMRFDPDSDALVDLAYPLGEDGWVVLHRDDPAGEFAASVAEIPYEVTYVVLTGEIESGGSFWLTCERHMLLRPSDILELAGIFEYDVDMATEVQPGDQVAVWIESLAIDGNHQKYGHVLGARYIQESAAHEAVRFTPDDGKPGYYTEDGMSTRKRFLRSPLQFSRVASGFARSRYHPILHKNRPHLGTDFSAPSGTPVRALGDGRVTFAGWKGGYGKLVIIQHDRTYSTRYGHFSRFGKGIEAGTNVEQGQTIGYVGATGLATGPHLHFEFRVDGAAVDFMKQEFPNTEPVSQADRPRFDQVRDEYLAHLDAVLPPPAVAPPPADSVE